MSKRATKALVIASAAIVLVGAITLAGRSWALSGSSWKAGNIIEDSVFFDNSAMTVNEIQDFLNALVPSCDTWGKKMYNSTQTRAQFGTSQGTPPPYICVKNYYENPTTHETNFNSTATKPSGSISAAQIIYNAAQQYNINPKVLLVTIKKEAADNLIEDDWPWLAQYRSALGFGCPDSAACDSQYYGFYNQVTNAAKQFWLYARYPDSYRRKAGGTYAIAYHPYNNCASPNVYMQNQATAGLYNYTPYQPNAAALANLYGTGDSCSSYGNRNFWRIWNDWFGSTHSSIKFVSMDTPRWMQLKQDTTKIEPFIQTPVDNSDLTTGQQIYFDNKITINGITYLRTRHDTGYGYNKVVPLSLLEEVSQNYISLLSPRWLETTEDVQKIDPTTERPVGSTIKKGTRLFLATKTTIGDSTYLRTVADTTNNNQLGIPVEKFQETTIPYSSLANATWMIAVKDTRQYDLRYPAGTSTPTIAAGTILYIDRSVDINGETYLIPSDTTSESYLGIPSADLRVINDGDITYSTNQGAYMVNKDTNKIGLPTGKMDTNTIQNGSVIYFQGLITLNGKQFLQSAHDMEGSIFSVIPVDDLTRVSVTFEAMKQPRQLKASSAIYKIDPTTSRRLDADIPKGAVINFSQKLVLDGKLYLRTSYDTDRNNDKVIPFDKLSEI